VADHDAEDRATLLENGISTIPARKDVNPGIEAVQERLKPVKTEDPPRPRLFVLRDSLVERDRELAESKRPCCLIEEIDGYVWAKGVDGRVVKDAPVKEDDHAMDALRYATMAIDRGVTAREPEHAREAREAREMAVAEAEYRDPMADHWWTN
jgi:hypothetical protein